MAKGGRRARSGRSSKPVEMKLIQNTFRPDRDGGKPHPAPKWPDPPAILSLSERQREIWAVLGLDSSWHVQTDWPAVWGEVQLIDLLLKNHAAQLETDTSGHPLSFAHKIIAEGEKTIELVTAEENPLISQNIKLFDKLRAFIVLNGHSPVDRARMPAVGEVKAENPLEKLIHRQRA